ncbi:DUF6302 family protein [Streptomyces sp. H10-C2]|uniref:DUF6302 family protein n=1 Tax=unclassified Streptomyces TaxID=2593676 RepID=UPI0024B901A2|nr:MULTISPECIES: DUF6302 family protein [unclassified Streptomyces]MDJ0347419.1 DUF6302 family protein [Streptomyces sp. PH10-H1]MDJ0375658.1 DUF6302 family protein [Streptomyces sp. H10-C2]
MTVIRPLIPRLVPAPLAYDFEYIASRLADPSLLDHAVAVCVHRAPFLAVPVGGARRGGSMAFDLLILAEKTRGLLEGLPGFPDVRVRPSPYRDTCHVVEWGGQPPACDYNDAARGRFYGYSKAAVPHLGDGGMSRPEPSHRPPVLT